jgi:ferric-dicitrate binding protein FerR (iron transport regulator)
LNTPQHDIDELIARVATGEATPAEHQQLEIWSAQHPDNARYVRQLRTIFERAVHAPPLNVNADAAWKKVQQKIKSKTPVVPLWSGPRIARLAAGIAMVVGGSYLAIRFFAAPIQNQQVVAQAETRTEKLLDGTQAVLNRNTQVVYTYHPRKKERKVKLEGEAFFEIEPRPGESFTLEADELRVRDIGTAFNVRAWAERDTIEIVVETGLVQAYTETDRGILIRASEKGYYRKSTKTFWKEEFVNPNDLAYKTKVLVFNNTDLRTVVKTINNVYGARVALIATIENCRITAEFKDQKLDFVLDVIAETLGLSIEKQGPKDFVLHGNGCQ